MIVWRGFSSVEVPAAVCLLLLTLAVQHKTTAVLGNLATCPWVDRCRMETDTTLYTGSAGEYTGRCKPPYEPLWLAKSTTVQCSAGVWSQPPLECGERWQRLWCDFDQGEGTQHCTLFNNPRITIATTTVAMTDSRQHPYGGFVELRGGGDGANLTSIEIDERHTSPPPPVSTAPAANTSASAAASGAIKNASSACWLEYWLSGDSDCLEVSVVDRFNVSARVPVALPNSTRGTWSRYRVHVGRTAQGDVPVSPYHYVLATNASRQCTVYVDDIRLLGADCPPSLLALHRATPETSRPNDPCSPGGKEMSHGGQRSCFCPRYAYGAGQTTPRCSSSNTISSDLFYCTFDEGHSCGMGLGVGTAMRRGSRDTADEVGDYSTSQTGYYLTPVGTAAGGELRFPRGPQGKACKIECSVSWINPTQNNTLTMIIDGTTVNGKYLPGGTAIWRRAEFDLSSVAIRSTSVTHYQTFVSWSRFRIDNVILRGCDYGTFGAMRCTFYSGHSWVVALRNNANGYHCFCRPGYTGEACEKSCCAAGYRDYDCKTPCPPTKRWGPACAFPCRCPHGVACEGATGACLCDKPGISGHNCSTPCDPSHYGVGCVKKCECRNGAACNATDGACSCSAGFHGDRCQSACPALTWGEGCARACQCSNSAGCDPRTGTCQCPKQFAGANCSQCAPDYSGERCQHHCPCDNGGVCPSSQPGKCRCPPGYQGKRCQRRCSADRWGQDCGQACDCRNGAACNRVTGRCECEAAFTGAKCNRCALGYSGETCQDYCLCAHGGTCHNGTSTCTCASGFTGPRCEATCSPGTWGVNCLNKCACQNATSCHPQLGCRCVRGFAGVYCERLIVCPDVVLPPTVLMVSQQGTWYMNRTQTQCPTGTVLRRGQHHRVCQRDGTWSGSPAECGQYPADGVAVCPQQYANTSRGLFLWPATPAGETRRVLCPVTVDDEEVGLASRECLLAVSSTDKRRHSSWDAAQTAACPFLSARTRKLNKIARLADTMLKSMMYSMYSIGTLATATEELTANATDLDGDEVFLTADIVDALASSSADVFSALQTHNSTEVGRVTSSFVNIVGSISVSSVLAARAPVTAATNGRRRRTTTADDVGSVGSDIHRAAETFVESLPLCDDNEKLVSASGSALLASICPHTSSDYELQLNTRQRSSGRNASALDFTRLNITIGAGHGDRDSGGNSGSSGAGISFRMPHEALHKAGARESQRDNAYSCRRAKANFVVYARSNAIFPVDAGSNESIVSPVISAKAGTAEKLQLNSSQVIMTFPLESIEAGLSTAFHLHYLTCTYWNTTSLQWSTDGCSRVLRNSSVGTPVAVQCRCNHLTSFALMLRPPSKRGADAQSLSAQGDHHARALSIISLVGCSLSVVCLLITITSILVFRELRQRLRQRMTVCLSFSLLAVMLLFIVAGFAGLDGRACRTVGVLLHYFLLATFTWLLLQATLLYRQLVVVFQSVSEKFFTKAAALSTLVPMAIVTVTAWTTGMSAYSGSGFCFLATDAAYYGGFLGPLIAMVLYNGVVQIIVTFRVAQSDAKRRSMDSKPQLNRFMFLLNLVVFLSTIMGTTWLLGTLAAFIDSLALQYVFALLSTVQGAVIFYFNTLASDEVRVILRKTYKTLSVHSTLSYSRRRNSSVSATTPHLHSCSSVPSSSRARAASSGMCASDTSSHSHAPSSFVVRPPQGSVRSSGHHRVTGSASNSTSCFAGNGNDDICGDASSCGEDVSIFSDFKDNASGEPLFHHVATASNGGGDVAAPDRIIVSRRRSSGASRGTEQQALGIVDDESHDISPHRPPLEHLTVDHLGGGRWGSSGHNKRHYSCSSADSQMTPVVEVEVNDLGSQGDTDCTLDAHDDGNNLMSSSTSPEPSVLMLSGFNSVTSTMPMGFDLMAAGNCRTVEAMLGGESPVSEDAVAKSITEMSPLASSTALEHDSLTSRGIRFTRDLLSMTRFQPGRQLSVHDKTSPDSLRQCYSEFEVRSLLKQSTVDSVNEYIPQTTSQQFVPQPMLQFCPTATPSTGVDAGLDRPLSAKHTSPLSSAVHVPAPPPSTPRRPDAGSGSERRAAAAYFVSPRFHDATAGGGDLAPAAHSTTSC